MEDVAAGLQQRLIEVTFTSKDADEVTELLLSEVADWGTGQGWRAYRKAQSVLPLPPPYADKFSWVDLAFARPGAPPLVVEIDRSDRQRTVEKLLAEAQAGRVAIWVRWGQGELKEPPPPVLLVKVPVTAQGKRYSSPGPDRPAPEHSNLDFGDVDQMDLF